MRKNEPATNISVSPETLSKVNEIKKELDKNSRHRITADDTVRILVEYYENNIAREKVAV